MLFKLLKLVAQSTFIIIITFYFSKEKGEKQLESKKNGVYIKETDNLQDKKEQNSKNLKNFPHGFRIIKQNAAIMRGSFSMNDKRFGFRSRGLQAVACCTVAIVFNNLLDSQDWTEYFLDCVLTYGDKVFRLSCTKNRIKPNVNMTANLIYPEFFIGDYKCSICATENIVYGNLFTENMNCLDLRNGVDKFFKSSEAGILIIQGFSVAIWRHKNGEIFYFDPAPCADDGIRCDNGKACLVRFKCLNDMLNFLLSTLNQKENSKYSIDRIKILNIISIRSDFLLSSETVENLNNTNVTCINLTSERHSFIKTSKVRRVPVSVSISNSNIAKRVELFRTQNSFDTEYTYSDMRVNVPSSFKYLSDTVSILHGSTHEGSEIYKGKGAQNLANCLLSIGMKEVNPVATWLKTTLDEILLLGDALYIHFKIDKASIKELSAINFNGVKFQIGEQKMLANVDLVTIIGTLNSRITSVLNLKQGLEEFFLVYVSGIIETLPMTVAIWTDDEYYYIFDPHQCDRFGFRVVEEKKVNGKCCVMRFKYINSLAAHFIQNIPVDKKNDRFVIRKIDIFNDVPGIQPWHNFAPGEPGKTWLLQGSVTNDEEKFINKNNGIQNFAVSIVSLIFAKNKPPSEWTKKVVDTVVREGDTYYNWCIFPDEEDKQFDFSKLKKVLYVSNQRVDLELEEAVIVGEINVRMESRYLKIEESILQFFEKYQYGLVEVNNMAFSVWKELDPNNTGREAYYLFLSNPMDESKEKSVPYVVRTLNLAEIAKIITTNTEYDTESCAQFLLHNVKIVQIGNVMTNEEIENDKKIALKPDFNKYSKINEDTACLNGSTNQSDEVLFNQQTCNKQQAGNAIVALAMKKLYNPHLWTKQVVDDILKMGDKITAENIHIFPSTEEEASRNWLLPTEIRNEFDIGVNHIRFEIEENSAEGQLINLQKILEEFFTEKYMGIFKQNSTIMPIWKQGLTFFTMDPKGRDNQGVQREKDGTAAVLWFTSISALASDLFTTAGSIANSNFSIDSILIKNRYKKRSTDRDDRKIFSTEDVWYAFEKKFEGFWVIDGNISFTNDRFDKENRGKQSATIAIMAILFSQIYSPQKWKAEVLDKVIVTGDKLYSNCVARLESNHTFRVNEIMPEFFLSDRRIKLSFIDCVQSGEFDSNSPKIQDLLCGINKFFNQYSSGILTANSYNINFAIWKFDDFYYCLLPESRLMRFAKITDFIHQLLTKFSILDYEIIATVVMNWNKLSPGQFDPSEIICPLSLPPLNAFKRLNGAARAFLYGTSHQAPKNVQNRQAAANCIVALGMSVVKRPDTWTKNTLDEILSFGNSLYHESLKAQSAKDKLRPTDIIRIFYVGNNIFTANVSTPIISGQVSISPREPETKGKEKQSKPINKSYSKKKKTKARRESTISSPLILLAEGINKFFENNNAGVLIIGRSVLSIWKQLGVYFLYVSHAINSLGDRYNYGSSCTAWFACIEPFHNFIYTTLDNSEKNSTFEIYRILLKTTIIEPLPCSADFNFCEISSASINSTGRTGNITLSGIRRLNTDKHDYKQLSILHGTRNLCNVMFNVKNRGRQSTAIAVVAIVVGSIYIPSTWTARIIDKILVYGNCLHVDSCKLLRISSRNLSPCEINTVFIVGDFRAHVHVHYYTMTGLLYPYDVAETLHFFFKNNACGILHANNVAIAVSQHYGKFYLFDPGCQSNIEKSIRYKPASIIKFADIDILAHAFIAICGGQKSNVYTLNAVNILSLHSFSNNKTLYLSSCIK